MPHSKVELDNKFAKPAYFSKISSFLMNEPVKFSIFVASMSLSIPDIKFTLVAQLLVACKPFESDIITLFNSYI